MLCEHFCAAGSKLDRVATHAIDRLTAVLVESGHSDGTARAIAANTVRFVAATGGNLRGEQVAPEVREGATAVMAAYERSRSGTLSEAARAIARLERSGVKLSAEEAGGIAQRLAHRATVAEGLLLSLDTQMGREQAVRLVGDEPDRVKLGRLLAISAAGDRFLAEALGYAKQPPRRKRKRLQEAPSAVATGGAVGAAIGAGAATVKKTATRAGTRSGGRKAGVAAADPKKQLATKEFEKLHPRARKGSPTGGQFMQKGEGMQTGTGSDRVRLLQVRLSELGFPIVADGRFGNNTEQALKGFQEKFGLKPTGEVDMLTVEALRNPPPLTRDEVEKALAAQENPPKKSKAAAKGKTKAKAKKAKGTRAASPSRAASNKGVSPSVAAAATGDTKAGDKSYGKPAAGAGASRAAGGSGTAANPATAQLVRRGDGMTGEPDAGVESIQQLLKALGYDLGKAGVDGRFGEDTEAAIRKFQQRNGLRVDGVVGPQTKAMLRRRARSKERAAAKEKPTAAAAGPQAKKKGLKEASYRNIKPPTPFGTRVVYGGVIPPTVYVETGTEPPNLRESNVWHRCGNCVHWDGERKCLLFEWMTGHDDICAEHRTLSPQRRHAVALEEARREMVSARAARDGGRFARARARAMYHEERIGMGQLQESDSRSLPDLPNKPGKSNWVEKAGGLPKYIERIAKHLHSEKGMELGRAIATAVNVVKKMCASGDTNFPGTQQVNAKARAEACKAVADWNRKRGQSKVQEAAVAHLERVPIGKGQAGLGFAVRTIREVVAIDALPEADQPEYLREGLLEAYDPLQPRKRRGGPHGGAWVDWAGHGQPGGRAPQGRAGRAGKASPAAGGYKGVSGALDPDSPEARKGTVVELSPLHDGQMKTFEEMGIDHPSYFSSAAAAKAAGQAMLSKHREPIGFHTRKLLANVPGRGSGRVRNLHLELRQEQGGGKASPSAGGKARR